MIKEKVITIISITAVLLLMVTPVSAFEFEPIPIDIDLTNVTYDIKSDPFISGAFTENYTNMDLWEVFMSTLNPYEQFVGEFLFAIMLGIYALSLWLRSNNIVLVFLVLGITAPLLGSVLIPEAMILFLVVGAVGTGAVIFRLLRGRR